MANNTQLSVRVGDGDNIRDIDKSGTGAKTQVILIDVGGSGAESLIGDGGTLPVSGTVAATQSGSWTATVSGTVAATQSGTWNVTNAGTFAVQAAQSGTWNITNISGTVSLPTGAATEAKQDTGNTSLASIDGKTPALGQALAAASVPVVLTAAQISTLTPLSTVAATQSGSWTVSISGTPTISGTVTANQGGSWTVAATQSGTWNIATVSTVTSLSQWAGNAIDTNSGNKSAGTLRVVLATDQPTLSNAQPVSQSGTWNVGTVTTVTTVSTVTAVSDASVQGKAAIDAAISGNPVLEGNRASAAVPSAVSNDGDVQASWTDLNGRRVVKFQCATPSQSSVAGSASNVTILAANSSRLGATVYNDSSAILYLKLGATATTSSFTVAMAASSYYEVPFGYAGIIDGIWASATGNARITELT